MQKYHSIADVALELRRVADKITEANENGDREAEETRDCVDEKEKIDEKVTESVGNGSDHHNEAAEHEEYDSPPESEITDSG